MTTKRPTKTPSRNTKTAKAQPTSDAERQRERRARLRKAGLIEFRFLVPSQLVAGDPDAFRERVQRTIARMKPAS